MKRLAFIASIISLSVLFFVGGCSSGSGGNGGSDTSETGEVKDQIVLRLVTTAGKNPPGKYLYEPFIQRVESLSNGELKIEWLGAQDVIAAPDLGSAVQDGSVDMGCAIWALLPPPANAAECIQMSKVPTTDWRKLGAFDLIQELFEQSGLYCLGEIYNVEPHRAVVLGLKKPVSSVKDLAGLNIAFNSLGDMAVLQAFGANPTRLSYLDKYTALERGAIDGTLVSYMECFEFSLQEVLPYMLDEGTQTGGQAITINLDKWNSLPPHLQEVLKTAAIEHEVISTFTFWGMDAWYKQAFLDFGNTLITLPEEEARNYHETAEAAMWESLNSTYPDYAPQFKELIDP